MKSVLFVKILVNLLVFELKLAGDSQILHSYALATNYWGIRCEQLFDRSIQFTEKICSNTLQTKVGIGVGISQLPVGLTFQLRKTPQDCFNIIENLQPGRCKIILSSILTYLTISYGQYGFLNENCPGEM